MTTPTPGGERDRPISVKNLKDCLDALEKLKTIRRELKAKLNKEGLRDEEEVDLATHLSRISDNIELLEREKLRRVTIPDENSEQPAPGATSPIQASSSLAKTAKKSNK